MSQEQLCAKITTNNLVEQVIVCDSVEWCQTSLGGTWIKVTDSTGKCGIGSVYKSDVNTNTRGIGVAAGSELSWYMGKSLSLCGHFGLTGMFAWAFLKTSAWSRSGLLDWSSGSVAAWQGCSLTVVTVLRTVT